MPTVSMEGIIVGNKNYRFVPVNPNMENSMSWINWSPVEITCRLFCRLNQNSPDQSVFSWCCLVRINRYPPAQSILQKIKAHFVLQKREYFVRKVANLWCVLWAFRWGHVVSPMRKRHRCVAVLLPFKTGTEERKDFCFVSGADPGFWSGGPSGVLTPGGPEPKICSK